MCYDTISNIKKRINILEEEKKLKILKEHKGYQLIERYNKRYIRFFGGRDENMPCEFPITQEQSDKAIERTELIEEYISQFKKKVFWSAETFFEIGIMEYIINALGKNQEYAKKAYEKLCKYKDIRDEFYNYIMNEEFSKENIIKVEGYTAEELCNTTILNPLGAYNYLIYFFYSNEWCFPSKFLEFFSIPTCKTTQFCPAKKSYFGIFYTFYLHKL